MRGDGTGFEDDLGAGFCMMTTHVVYPNSKRTLAPQPSPLHAGYPAPVLLYILLSMLFTLALSLCFSAPQESAPAPQVWHQWRGPLGTGAAPDANPPLSWSEEHNLRWKSALPGLGQSSPVVTRDLIFLTSAIPIGEKLTLERERAPGAHDNMRIDHVQRFVGLAFSRDDGQLLWQTTLAEGLPHAPVHKSGSYASASPVTDGERLFAYFGSNGLYALNLKGELLWKADLGQKNVKHDHGEGSTPALFGETIVLNWDHEGQSAIVAIDTLTGKERWRKLRNEPTSWASPIIIEQDGIPLVIASATGRIRAYTLSEGELIWECGGLSNNVVATPVAGLGMLFAGSSYVKKAFVAIRLAGAKGDLGIGKAEHVAWVLRRRTPYVPSPLLSGKWLYFLQHYQGTLSRVDAKTGKEPNRPQRISGIRDVYASPVAAADRIYVVDRSGETVVLSEDAELQILSRNLLNDSFSASPALADDALYLRGDRWLYCLAQSSDK